MEDNNLKKQFSEAVERATTPPSGNVGVINEQGFVAGSFGFQPLNEDERENLEKDDTK